MRISTGWREDDGADYEPEKPPADEDSPPSLWRRRERQAEGEYLGDGIKLLEEALRWSAPLTAAVFADGVEPPDLPKEVRAVQVPGDVMESISPMAAPQGALFLAALPPGGPARAAEGEAVSGSGRRSGPW